ncbi:MAG TPA: FemAB family protein [Burkholderiaceae bacterium]
MQARLHELLELARLEAVPFERAPAAWHGAWDSLSYQPAAYSRATLDYQRTYLRGTGRRIDAFDLVLLHDGRPCGLWPLMLSRADSMQGSLSSCGKAVYPPLLHLDLAPRAAKKLTSRAVALAGAIAAELGAPTVTLEQPPSPGSEAAVSEWHRQAMLAGATATLHHDLYADLRPPLQEIRSTFRKSYRPLVNVALRQWSSFVMDETSADASVWDEFQDLHRVAAGKRTRSEESWALQFDMITKGVGFLVGLRDGAGGPLVGAGFFQCTRDEGLYAVGAYNRALFDKPLGHAVQQRAIETMKARGLRWYCIGERVYPQETPPPSAKEVSISDFKEGFASLLAARFRFALPSRPLQPPDPAQAEPA